MTPTSTRFHYGWLILVMATLVVFGSLGLARFGYTVVLPSMQKGLGMDNTQAGLLATANLIGYLALSAIGGALASRLGPRVVITAGLAVAGISMILTGFVDSIIPAALWRALTGIGSGASNVPVMGLISAWFAAKRRGMAAGIAVSGSSIALIFLGPSVPPLLNTFGENGWRACWFIFGAVTLILAIAGYIILQNRPSGKGLEQIGAGNNPIPSSASQTVKLEWGKVYKSLSVWHLGVVYACFGFSYIIYMTFFTKHLITTGGYTEKEAGNLFMITGWFSLLCGLIWGTVSDKIGRKYALIIVFTIQALSFLIFGIWTVPAGFLISAVLFGITAWSIPAIMAAACGDRLGPRMAPAALGFITLLFGIGQAAGPGVAGALADSTGSFLSAFILAGSVALGGSLTSLLIKNDKGKSAH